MCRFNANPFCSINTQVNHRGDNKLSLFVHLGAPSLVMGQKDECEEVLTQEAQDSRTIKTNSFLLQIRKLSLGEIK